MNVIVRPFSSDLSDFDQSDPWVQFMVDNNYLAVAPIADDRAAFIEHSIFGAEIILGSKTMVTDRFFYGTFREALIALCDWDPQTQEEPFGWIKHKPSGRSRPEGDSFKEYVNDAG